MRNPGSNPDDNPNLLAAAQATTVLLFSESNSRFLCEVHPDAAARFEQVMAGTAHRRIGQVIREAKFQVHAIGTPASRDEVRSANQPQGPLVINADLADLKEAWQAPLRWA
ncbi:MAG: hypothetical protein A2W31_10195 [Planctomycetes bacterium RBG_16_64_10]|nr:MAG: hypothetical protein A2W31_10195 [Planctomycetes bacterium RBG_16_64_10]